MNAEKTGFAYQIHALEKETGLKVDMTVKEYPVSYSET